MYEQVFSEFEVKKTSIKFHDEEASIAAKPIGCVGSLGETLNVRKISKKCEGVEVKTVTKGTGTGELALSLHMEYDLFAKSYGMLSDGYKDGVLSYGQKSVHKTFCLTCEVYDEDGNLKLKAYPNCVVSTGISRNITNGEEEVAEIDFTITVNPDDSGQGMYEIVVTDTTAEDIKTSWLTNFTPELVKAPSV